MAIDAKTEEFYKAYDWWYKLPLAEQKRLNIKVLGEKDRLDYNDFIKLWRNKDA